MKNKDFEFNGPSRSGQRAKRRKTNLILNSLIVIVLLLIIIVSFSIFFSNGDEASTNETKQTSQQDETAGDESVTTDEKDQSESSSEEGETDQSVPASSDETNTEIDADTGTEGTDDTNDLGEDTVIEGSSTDSNVKATITNPDWQPVGTVQTGEHVTVYDAKSVDWQEMLQAISYGTGIDQGNMTVWFLGRNQQGSDGHSVATVSTKDNALTYRVYLEWVNGQGWKPSKIEELHQNDKR
jgi:cytoskeletal protein RodZ